MYYRYFGLQEEPFSIAVNPKYLFMSARHRDALAHLLYGVGTGGGFILLTGEVGTGKTTINRCLMQQLPGETDVAIILNPALNAEELLASVCDELHIDYPREDRTLKTLTDSLHAFLLENHGRGRNTVLLIDEAQHLQFEVLEQIRLLTNLETNTRKLLQIILVGQPELTALLSKPELRQLNQRITARYNLKPLNLEETDAYIRHRLQVAGLPANQELFPRSVVRKIHRRTRGIPRLINVLCDRMLLGTYGQNKTRVDAAMLRQAAAEVLGEQEAERIESARSPWAYAALLATVLLGVLAYLGWQQPERFAATVSPLFVEPGVPVPQPETAGRVVTAPVPASQSDDPDLAIDEVLLVAPGITQERSPEVGPAVVSPLYESPVVWYGDESAALAELARYLGLVDLPPGVDCAALEPLGWWCERQSVDTWNELQVYNQPALLALVTPERFAAHALLVGVEGQRATLWHESGFHELSLLKLGRLWQGDFLFLWQPPPDYAGPVSLGDQGPVVAWLAREFAALDGQEIPLAQEQFNAALDQRVRLFQRRYDLLDDGVVGLRTLLKLEELRSQNPPPRLTAPAVADMGAR